MYKTERNLETMSTLHYTIYNVLKTRSTDDINENTENILTAVMQHIDTLDRAPWWRELKDETEHIPAGCPVRSEWPSTFAQETYKTYDRTAKDLLTGNQRAFVDTRWIPTPTYKTGDTITECNTITKPTQRIGLIDRFENIGQLIGDYIYWTSGMTTHWEDVDEERLPLAVIFTSKYSK